MKKLIYILLSVIVAGGMYYKLTNNQKEIAAKSDVA